LLVEPVIIIILIRNGNGKNNFWLKKSDMTLDFEVTER